MMTAQILATYTDRELLEYLCERAAVREYDGRMSREQATVASAVELRKVIGKLPGVILSEVERVRG